MAVPTEPSCEEGALAEARVFLVDDHELFRRGLRDLLGELDDFDIVGEAGTVAAALEAVDRVNPDLVLIDVRLPDGDGIQLCREIRSRLPDARCVIVTAEANEDAVLDAVMAGAVGFVLKRITGAELVDAVRRVVTGQSLLDPAVTGRVLDRLRRRPEEDARLRSLTPQEQRILDLIAEGMTNRQMAGRLHLTEKTVKNYVSNVLAKLGMEHRTQAALYAAKLEADKRRLGDATR